MTDPAPIETFPLFPDLEPCGCPKDQGHDCRPSWCTDDEWDAAGHLMELWNRGGDRG